MVNSLNFCRSSNVYTVLSKLRTIFIEWTPASILLCLILLSLSFIIINYEEWIDQGDDWFDWKSNGQYFLHVFFSIAEELLQKLKPQQMHRILNFSNVFPGFLLINVCFVINVVNAFFCTHKSIISYLYS